MSIKRIYGILRLELSTAIYTKIKCIAEHLVSSTQITSPGDIHKFCA